MSFVYGVFIVLHGLVHLLYFGQSARRLELKPGMVWPDGSWALARLIGNGSTRNPASISSIPVAIAFTTGGMGILVSHRREVFCPQMHHLSDARYIIFAMTSVVPGLRLRIAMLQAASRGDATGGKEGG